MAHRDVLRVSPFLLACVVSALFVLLGVAPQQTVASDSLLPVQTDSVCASDCGERGYDGEYCARACAIAPASLVPSDEVTDLRCQARCRKRGGTYASCHRECSSR